MALQRAFLLSMVVVAPTLAPLTAQAQAVPMDRRAVALQWDGIAGPVPGVLDLAPDGSGTLRFQMRKPARLCIGTITVIEGQPNGSWALACGDGMAASGRYLRQDRQALGEGKGVDTSGHAVSFAVGVSLLPPAEAVKAPPVVEPRKAEARKEEPPKRPAAANAAPPREPAASTADALNEAELRKARERNWETSVQGAIAAPRAPTAPSQPAALQLANQLTGAELNVLSERLKPCWNPNFGGRNTTDLVVEVEIYANPDGTIAQARPRQNVRMASDPFYQSAVDAAMRAVLRPQCGGIGGRPLPLPREKYEQWKSFVLVFDPKAMLGAKAPVDAPAAVANAGAGDQSCSISGPGLDFGLSVLAANLSCRLLSGLGEQVALAQQYQTDRAKRAVILETCQQRLRDQPEAASQTDAQLRRRCETIGASFPLMVYFGGFPSAAERAQAVDACVAEGGAAQTEDQRREAGKRCAAEVAARIEAARDPSRVLVQVQANPPAPAEQPKPAPRPRKPVAP